MILDITQDPQWLEQRNKLWLELERDISEGLTRKQIKGIKDFFFTGIVAKNSWLNAVKMLVDFPVFTVEGITWCLQNQVDASLSDDDFQSIQRIFGLLHHVPGLDCEEQVFLFNYVFGERYDPHRLFPFLLGDETQCRPITLHVNLAFDYLTSVFHWLGGDDESYAYMAQLIGYFFSLVPFVDERLFQLEEGRGSLPGSVGLASCQCRLKTIMRACFTYPKGVAVEGETQRRYLAEFKARMDNLDHYPGELKQLWLSIKAEYA
jgi:hypothetical protein